MLYGLREQAFRKFRLVILSVKSEVETMEELSVSAVQDNVYQRNHTQLKPFLLQKLLLSGVIGASLRIKLGGSNLKWLLGCFLKHKHSEAVKVTVL